MSDTISTLLTDNFERDALAPYADWTLDAYIAHWEDVHRRGGRIPKAFDKVLQRALGLLLDHSTDTESVHHIPQAQPLEGTQHVPLTDLLTHFSEKGDSIAVNRLRSGGIHSIADLLSISYTTLKNIPYIGHNTIRRALIFKRWIIDHQQMLLDRYIRRSVPIYLPERYDPDEPLLNVLHTVLLEASPWIMERADDQSFARTPREATGMKLLASLLELRYRHGLSFADIAASLNRTSWHITKTHTDFVAALCHGEKTSANLKLQPALLIRLTHVKEKALWHRDNVFGHIIPTASTLINILGLDILEIVPGIRIVIPARELCHFTAKGKAVLRELRAGVTPVSHDEFMTRLKKCKEFKGSHSHTDTLFVNAILAQPELVTVTDDGRFTLNLPYLVSDEQRIARIIHDNGQWMTRNEIFDQYRRLMGRDSNSVNLSNLRKYGIHSSGDLWIYGKKLQPVNHFISDWTRRKRIFHMHELEAALQKEGYPILPRIRAYITAECMVDNDDSNHFCHKTATPDYPGFSWRKPGRSGLSNWILLQIKNLTEHTGHIPYDQLVDTITERAVRRGNGAYMRQRIKSALSTYSGPDMPFILADGIVSRNMKVFNSVNFATIGRRGHNRTDEYTRIRREAVKSIAASPHGQVQIVDFMKQLAEIGLGHINRNSCLRALTSAYLDPIPLRVANLDGILFIVHQPLK